MTKLALLDSIVSLLRVADNIYPFALLKKLDLCQKDKIFYKLTACFHIDCLPLKNVTFNHCAAATVEKVDLCESE